MANRRNLKKNIDYLCEEMTIETCFCAYQLKSGNAKFAEIAERIDQLNIQFKSRIQRYSENTNNQLVKQNFKQIRKDFDSEVEKIYAELKSLNPEYSEN